MTFDSYISKIENSSVIETQLTTKNRNILKNSQFGLPKQRKYPLVDDSHIHNAVVYFKHAPEKDRAELAKNIQKAANRKEIELRASSSNPITKYIDNIIIIPDKKKLKKKR